MKNTLINNKMIMDKMRSMLPHYVMMVFCWLTLTSSAQYGPDKKKGPKLVLGIVVDQMRWDYLYRFQDRYGMSGFNRLLREGFSFENAYIDYVSTVTASGHATVYTGAPPSIHGITGNSFIMQATGKTMYCTEDDSARTVGSTSEAGKMSPRNLLSSTITDELKLATNFRSKVIGIALKDRGAILPMGRFADAAYWFDDSSGGFITSSYYRDSLPAWLNVFNAKKLPSKYLAGNWETLYPLETYRQSMPDNTRYEGKYRGSANSSFPVTLSALAAASGVALVKNTPFGNTLTLDLAREVILNEKLGSNSEGITDFLALSLSSTDYIGHQFSVNSIKIEDTYLRLDRELTQFFTFLDNTIGKGAYSIFLTADHAGAHNAGFYRDKKGNAGYFNNREVLKALNIFLEEKSGEKDLVISLLNYQIHLNNGLIKNRKLDKVAIETLVVDYMRELPAVAHVTRMEDATHAPIPEMIRERIVNGYHHKRSGAIQFILEPQYYSGSEGATGTSHGNWYAYDSHIPLLWMGHGIRAGKSNRPVYMTDIAPTVAALLHIQEPNGNVGRVLGEVLK